LAPQATTKLPGSSTACVAQLRRCGTLEVVNLGDSGLRLVRAGRVEWSTSVQEHVWNCPYQLSHPRIVPQTDTVEDAAVARVDVMPGDIIVLGTDGLFDNMWEHELLEVVEQAQGAASVDARLGRGEGEAGRAAAVLARRLAAAAARNAADPWYRGPWAEELQVHGKVGRGTGRGRRMMGTGAQGVSEQSYKGMCHHVGCWL
jgi:protein phosphatase PTC7